MKVFSTINNMVGDITIGSQCRIGLGNTIIGPVKIGDNVNLGQNILIAGLHHNYTDPQKTIISQGVRTSKIIIEDDVLIGGKLSDSCRDNYRSTFNYRSRNYRYPKCPTKFCCSRQPGKVIKQYNPQTKEWENIHHKITDK